VRDAGTKQVTEINIYTSDNVLIKTVSFYYSSNSFHTFLDLVKITDSEGKIAQTYSFEYYSKTFDPSKQFIADQWGYYKEVTDQDGKFHLDFEDDPVFMQSGSVPQTVGEQSGAFGFNIRDAINLTPDYFSLKTITYPTGGKTVYEYESNKYLDAGGTVRTGGGIRTKKIHSNDLLNNSTLIREYKYGENESGYGHAQLLIDPALFASESIYLISSVDAIPNTQPVYAMSKRRVITYSTTIQGDVDPDGFLSSHVVYNTVTEYLNSNEANVNNGKTEFKYDLGQQYFTNNYYPGFVNSPCELSLPYADKSPMFISRYRIWNQPVLTGKIVYAFKNNAWQKLQEEQLNYAISFSTFTGLKVRPFASTSIYSPAATGDYNYYLYLNSFFRFGEYTLESGIKKLVSKQETLYYENGEIVSAAEYVYNAKNQIKQVKTQKSGYNEVQEYSYPTDFSGLDAADPVKLLQNLNMIQQPVEERKYRTDLNGANKRLVAATYKEFLSAQPLPVRLYSARITSPALDFNAASVSEGQVVKDNNYYQLDQEVNAYDSRGNILTYTTSNGTSISFIWDYNDEYPIAKIVNCAPEQAAFTSFEADGFGNWTGVNPAGIVQDEYSVTGNKYYQTSFNLSKSGMHLEDHYMVTYWSKNGSYSVAGTESGWPKSLQNVSLDGSTWTLYGHKVTGVSTITISGTGAIDELRLYPVGAQMTTYTYNPLIGMSSQSDISNKVVYYEYDGFGRLRLIRDQYRNILNKFDYHYQAPLHDNPVWTQTINTRCKPCEGNASYATTMLQNEERDSNPNSPTYNQTRWVDAGTSSNCVITPGWENTTTALRCKVNIALEYTGEQEQEQKDMNPCSPTFNQIRWIVVGTNTTACPPPACGFSCTSQGPEWKCINGNCELGIKVYHASVPSGQGDYICYYHYEYSDGSWSAEYSENATVPCSTN